MFQTFLGPVICLLCPFHIDFIRPFRRLRQYGYLICLNLYKSLMHSQLPDLLCLLDLKYRGPDHRCKRNVPGQDSHLSIHTLKEDSLYFTLIYPAFRRYDPQTQHLLSHEVTSPLEPSPQPLRSFQPSGTHSPGDRHAYRPESHEIRVSSLTTEHTRR